VAVDATGNALVSTDPSGGAGSWTVTRVDRVGSLNAVSCPSTSLCIAIDSTGHVVVGARGHG
jgi:hypothetical protein